ncbi:MAG TPA: type IV toxin-antitoxin system AbiEi family antitoxin domain-containing protein [Cellulomonas sp.]|uniref:type IV toxin-antitoxin system AbiEi family antitoxin domain-containing protein n=1 Tax=Cellulomonas sp. TaxID=40001 RepID=UPI002E32634D|nr:type IV toxin-antitoxin system AbiEi family antitoxin domain-containing protein [Cellulomonas sp.]HEX5332759.1 type IV toxin-antitoxin system AbiEi family antitoxin domain-containing protein [Cellulomonas sp.]
MAISVSRDWVPDAARGQGGVFTARQALAEGLTAAQVRRRIDTGRWVRVVGGALADSALEISPWQQAHAACLTWPDSVVCLGTAARLHRLPVPDDGLVHVVVPSPRASRGALTRHEFPLGPGDVTRLGQAAVTTRRRTVVDCLGRLPDDQSEALTTWVLTRRLLGPDELDRAIAARPGAWGNVRRRRALLDMRAGAAGPAERRLHRLLRGAGLTGWLPNESLSGHLGLYASADVYFPDVRLVIEIDGAAFHGPDRFQADRTRQNLLVGAGCTVLRFTWEDLTHRPAAVIAQIEASLRRLRALSRGF